MEPRIGSPRPHFPTCLYIGRQNQKRSCCLRQKVPSPAPFIGGDRSAESMASREPHGCPMASFCPFRSLHATRHGFWAGACSLEQAKCTLVPELEIFVLAGMCTPCTWLACADPGEMVQWLRALALGEDPGSLSSTHIRQLAATCNSGSRGSDALYWPLLAPEYT